MNIPSQWLSKDYQWLSKETDTNNAENANNGTAAEDAEWDELLEIADVLVTSSGPLPQPRIIKREESTASSSNDAAQQEPPNEAQRSRSRSVVLDAESAGSLSRTADEFEDSHASSSGAPQPCREAYVEERERYAPVESAVERPGSRRSDSYDRRPSRRRRSRSSSSGSSSSSRSSDSYRASKRRRYDRRSSSRSRSRSSERSRSYRRSPPRRSPSPKDPIGPMNPFLDWVCCKCKTANGKTRKACFKCCTSKADSEALEVKGYGFVGTVPCDTILVRGISATTTEEHIKHFLSRFKLCPKRIHFAPSKRFVLVEMESTPDVNYLLQHCGSGAPEINGNSVMLTFCSMTLEEFFSDKDGARTRCDIIAAKTAPPPPPAAATLPSNSNNTPVPPPVPPAAPPAPPAAVPKPPLNVNKGTVWTPVGKLQVYDPPVRSQFQYEPSTGYFYDWRTGYYFDEKSGYYYDDKKDAWLFWCSRYRTFLPANSSDPRVQDLKREEDETARNLDKGPKGAEDETVGEALRLCLEQNRQLTQALSRMVDHDPSVPLQPGPSNGYPPPAFDYPGPYNDRHGPPDHDPSGSYHPGPSNGYPPPAFGYPGPYNDRHGPPEHDPSGSYHPGPSHGYPPPEFGYPRSHDDRPGPPPGSWRGPPPHAFHRQQYAPDQGAAYPNNAPPIWPPLEFDPNEISADDMRDLNRLHPPALWTDVRRDDHVIPERCQELLCLRCGKNGHEDGGRRRCRNKPLEGWAVNAIQEAHERWLRDRRSNATSAEQYLKEKITRNVTAFTRPKDPYIRRLCKTYPSGLLPSAEIERFCFRCAELGHEAQQCTAERCPLELMRRVREQWRAFKKFFFWNLRDSPTLDLRERFKFLHVYHALEKPGDDPLSVRLQRHMPPHNMITHELLDTLCPNCGDFGHGLSECNEKPIDREEMEFLQNEIKTFKKIFEGRLKAGGISLYDFLETASAAEEEKPPSNWTVNEYVPGQGRKNAPYHSNFKLWPDFPLK